MNFDVIVSDNEIVFTEGVSEVTVVQQDDLTFVETDDQTYLQALSTTIEITERTLSIDNSGPVITLEANALAQGPPGGQDWSTPQSTVQLVKVDGVLDHVIHGVKGRLNITRAIDGSIESIYDVRNGITRTFNRNPDGTLNNLSIS